jgi:hypothetical protein
LVNQGNNKIKNIRHRKGGKCCMEDAIVVCGDFVCNKNQFFHRDAG